MARLLRILSLAIGVVLIGCLFAFAIALGLAVSLDPTAPLIVKAFFWCPVLLMLFLGAMTALTEAEARRA